MSAHTAQHPELPLDLRLEQRHQLGLADIVDRYAPRSESRLDLVIQAGWRRHSAPPTLVVHPTPGACVEHLLDHEPVRNVLQAALLRPPLHEVHRRLVNSDHEQSRLPAAHPLRPVAQSG